MKILLLPLLLYRTTHVRLKIGMLLDFVTSVVVVVANTYLYY